MVGEAAYPVLFGTTQASWAPIDLRFELLTGEVDPSRIARVYVVPFIGEACVVVGFEHGDWGPAQWLDRLILDFTETYSHPSCLHRSAALC